MDVQRSKARWQVIYYCFKCNAKLEISVLIDSVFLRLFRKFSGTSECVTLTLRANDETSL